MPCYDYRPQTDKELTTAISNERDKTAKVEALLCGVLSALVDNNVFNTTNVLDILMPMMDWEKIGLVPTDLVNWASEHDKEDASRRSLELDAQIQSLELKMKSIDRTVDNRLRKAEKTLKKKAKLEAKLLRLVNNKYSQ